MQIMYPDSEWMGGSFLFDAFSVSTFSKIAGRGRDFVYFDTGLRLTRRKTCQSTHNI